MIFLHFHTYDLACVAEPLGGRDRVSSSVGWCIWGPFGAGPWRDASILGAGEVAQGQRGPR